ncbi:MAG: DUF4093 domain-containing protein [Clostridia bacterium]|nr:DUF4093 domain-containing protein [Clostridia bacterium]
MEKLRLRQAVVVEGRYDKARLATLVDTLILTTGGFGIYKNKDQLALLRRTAKERGLIILTDSDAAGFRIRSYLASAIREGEVLHAYVPDVYGKERRKEKPGREGKLGVEGIEGRLILEAIRQAGASLTEEPPGRLTAADLYADGLVGGEQSAERRRRLCTRLGLPQRLSTKALLQCLNLLLDDAAYRAALASLKEEGSAAPK